MLISYWQDTLFVLRCSPNRQKAKAFCPAAVENGGNWRFAPASQARI